MGKHIPIMVNFSEETIKKMNEIASYSNVDHIIKPSKGKPTDLDYEDFILAAVNDKLDEIFNYMELVDYGSLGIQGKLKNRIKDFLDKTDMNQKDLSDKTGIHRTSLSTIMSNQKQPSLETFLRIWIAFKCPPIHELIYKEDD